MRIVMTGATRGIGLEAATRLLAREDVELVIGSRSGAGPLGDHPRLTVLRLDMARLASVRAFCAEVAALDGPVDVLILNAGLQLSRPQTSPDGYEMTFAVNHLAHQLMLQEHLAQLSGRARVILTGSGTHDPAEKTGVTPPDHADARKLAFPDTDPDLPRGTRQRCMRAYSSSKLSNIMTARHFARQHRELSVMSYDPGYVPGTGLARDYPKLMVPVIEFAVTRMLARDRVSTTERSGGFLADLAVKPDYAECRGDYWSVRSPVMIKATPSLIARDDAACAALWEDSAELLAKTA